MVRGKGSVLRTSLSQNVTPEYVRDVWDKVTDMSRAEHLDTITEATGGLMEILNALEGTDENNNGGKEFSDTFEFSNKDLVLYALGGRVSFPFYITIRFLILNLKSQSFSVGSSVKDNVELRFLYENHPEFAPLPSYFILPGLMLQVSSDLVGSALKHTEINLTQVCGIYVHLIKKAKLKKKMFFILGSPW